MYVYEYLHMLFHNLNIYITYIIDKAFKNLTGIYHVGVIRCYVFC